MTIRRILVIGSGKRVCEAALPVIARAHGAFELEGIISRTPKTIQSDCKDHEVLGFDSLTAERLANIDLIYMVVSKTAVPKVLGRLGEFDCSKIDMLIETPVMLVRHLGHRSRLKPFRNVWVSEDCITLPCFDVLTKFLATGAIGEIKSATFDRSAYAYHGMAMVKTVLGGSRIRSASQSQLEPGRRKRTITLANGKTATVFDPRDYSKGTFLFQGESGSVSDQEGSDFLLEPVLQGPACTAFRIGGVQRELSADEIELMGERSEGIGITAWMDGMKRVGFLNLLQRIADGTGAYPLEAAIEDSVVDYYLEKLGRYRATPITAPNSTFLRLAFSFLTKLTDR
ncbi:MAG: hypothetical protein ACI8X5_003337 [Planctomycetota bacterium]